MKKMVQQKTLKIIIVNHTKWVLQKHPVNASGVRDDLSGDMFTSSQPNLILVSYLNIYRRALYTQ